MKTVTLENSPIVWNSPEEKKVVTVANIEYVVYVDFTGLRRDEYEDALDVAIIETRANEPSRPLEDVLKDIETE